MPKAFDLIHKVNADPKTESRIPFEDNEPDTTSETPHKRRLRIEVLFFHGLLFIIFVVIGANFMSPQLFAGLFGKKNTPAKQTSPATSPAQGFTIEKEGQSNEEAAQELGITASPQPSSVASARATASATPTTKATAPSTAAQIQVLNGTNTTGAAAQLRTQLANKGIIVKNIGNYDERDVSRTIIYYKAEYRTAAEQVQAVAGGSIAVAEKGIGDYDILVVIGRTN